MSPKWRNACWVGMEFMPATNLVCCTEKITAKLGQGLTDRIQRFQGKRTAATSAQSPLGHFEVGQGVPEVAKCVLGRCGFYARNKSGALHRVNNSKVRTGVD